MAQCEPSAQQDPRAPRPAAPHQSPGAPSSRCSRQAPRLRERSAALRASGYGHALSLSSSPGSHGQFSSPFAVRASVAACRASSRASKRTASSTRSKLARSDFGSGQCDMSEHVPTHRDAFKVSRSKSVHPINTPEHFPYARYCQALATWEVSESCWLALHNLLPIAAHTISRCGS